MLFVFFCTDKPGHQDVRLANREAHLAYLNDHASQLVSAGPTLDDAGETMTGSVLVMDFENKAAAETFAAGDPYAQAGLFASVEIRQWKKVLPKD